MEIEKAEQAQIILEKINNIKQKIKWLSKKDTVLTFNISWVYIDMELINILKKHHNMIIQEFKDEIKELENQIKEL